MGWKASDEHSGKKADERGGWPAGFSHKDVYHTDEKGERDRPHHEDMKISFDSSKRDTADIKRK